MLRFFRLIRRKLIEEQKVRQYIYYAIGEILLVVIGILIALQVNNWNEKRIERNLRDDLIARYAKDLSSNKEYLESRMSEMAGDLKIIDDITVRLKNDPIHPDTLMKIGLIEFYPNYYSFAELKNDTYSSLVSNNELRIMPDELSSKMIAINFQMNDLIRAQALVSEFYRNSVTDYTSRYPMPEGNSIYSLSTSESLWNSLNKEEWMMAFNGVMFTKKASYLSVLPRADSLLLSINETLTHISHEYSNELN